MEETVLREVGAQDGRTRKRVWSSDKNIHLLLLPKPAREATFLQTAADEETMTECLSHLDFWKRSPQQSDPLTGSENWSE